MVPSEALAEPDSRSNRDRQEMREELKRFLREPPPIFGQRFLLWRASRPVGRLCFRVRNNLAHVGGLALLPSLEPDVITQVARIAIARAREARARSVTAAYEARHAPAFAAAGFRETRRYTPMMAATRLAEESEEEMATPIVNTLYQMRTLDEVGTDPLSELYRAVFSSGPKPQERSAANWLVEMLLAGSGIDDIALPECSFVAEFRRRPPSLPRLVGATLVSRWHGAAMIDDILVQPRYRRLGVGTNLLRQSILSLRQRGYASVMLVVMEGAPAQDFFRKLGFREVQTSYVEGEYIL
jgi:GNAT superfamily N-acetyltransferase